MKSKTVPRERFQIEIIIFINTINIILYDRFQIEKKRFQNVMSTNVSTCFY